MKKGIEDFVERSDKLRDSQHGFRRGRSPQTNLVEFMETTTKWMDEGKPFDMIYFDFQKAFDKVCHERLMVKLRAIGITGKVAEWVEDWLKGRKQRVVVQGEMSSWEKVISSVLQGTVLGGTLFNIFIDDIDMQVLWAIIKKFADDTKIARIVQSEEDARKLQEDIDRMYLWAQKWEMAFNTEKCKVIHVGKKNPRYKYKMGGAELAEAEEEKDLGVLMDGTMKPSKHCETVAKRANATLGMIAKAFHYRSSQTLLPLYKTFVRPQLEYASVAWSPWLEKDIEMLERVQRRAMRMVTNLGAGSYEEKLKKAGLTSLKERRKRGDLIEAYKTLNGINRVEKEKWFSIQEADLHQETRANSTVEEGQTTKKENVLVQERSNLEVRRNFYTVRVVSQWNLLPEKVKNQESLNAFKNSLDKWTEEEARRETN